MKKSLENEYVFMEIIDDILHVTYKSNAIITLDAAKKVVNDRTSLAEGKSMYVLGDVTNLKDSTKEARSYLNKDDGGLKGIQVAAFVSKEIYSYFILNIFLKIAKPHITSKIFPDKESALIWLKEIRASRNDTIQTTENE